MHTYRIYEGTKEVKSYERNDKRTAGKRARRFIRKALQSSIKNATSVITEGKITTVLFGLKDIYETLMTEVPIIHTPVNKLYKLPTTILTPEIIDPGPIVFASTYQTF